METQQAKPIVSYFYDWEKEKPDEIFLRQPKADEWINYSWKESGIQARKMARYLKSRFGGKRVKIGILSKNCAHWILADLAIFISNYVSVPFYANIFGQELNTLLDHSEVQLLFVGKLENWDKVKASIPDHIEIVSFPHYEGNDPIDAGKSWDEIMETTEPLTGDPLPSSSDLFTIMYTSGTTGKPKGVMLSNNQPAALLENERRYNDLNLFKVPNPRYFSYLPLNHIAERVIVEMAALSSGGSISFVESLDTFSKNLKETQPHAFIAVPRIWTKFQMAILEKLPQKKLNKLLKVPLVSNLIKRKIKNNLGLSKAQIILTGAAPIAESTLKWYKKLGITIQEVYAMTENCGGCSLMRSTGNKYGTVGKALTNTILKIDPRNNEVLMKAAWVMDGYYKDSKLTEEIIKDGFLHTGDQGHLDENGFLTLTGRVKDTFKCGKGKFVVPGPIELDLESCALLEQICVVGLGVAQPLALAVLSENARKKKKSDITQELQTTLEQVNKKLAKHEKLKAIVLMSEMWTVENELLTPTMKIKRPEIDKRYKTNYPDWFNEGSPVIWA